MVFHPSPRFTSTWPLSARSTNRGSSGVGVSVLAMSSASCRFATGTMTVADSASFLMSRWGWNGSCPVGNSSLVTVCAMVYFSQLIRRAPERGLRPDPEPAPGNPRYVLPTRATPPPLSMSAWARLVGISVHPPVVPSFGTETLVVEPDFDGLPDGLLFDV